MNHRAESVVEPLGDGEVSRQLRSRQELHVLHEPPFVDQQFEPDFDEPCLLDGRRQVECGRPSSDVGILFQFGPVDWLVRQGTPGSRGSGYRKVDGYGVQIQVCGFDRHCVGDIRFRSEGNDRSGWSGWHNLLDRFWNLLHLNDDGTTNGLANRGDVFGVEQEGSEHHEGGGGPDSKGVRTVVSVQIRVGLLGAGFDSDARGPVFEEPKKLFPKLRCPGKHRKQGMPESDVEYVHKVCWGRRFKTRLPRKSSGPKVSVPGPVVQLWLIFAKFRSTRSKVKVTKVNAVVPVKIHFSVDDATMHIHWQDGCESVLPLERVRRLCPCAVCEGRRSEDDGLQMITADQMASTAVVERVQKVGRYAVQIVWEDGHDSGIYTYAYLRQLDDDRPFEE